MLLHGPAGGDAQAGGLIATGGADVLVFFGSRWRSSRTTRREGAFAAGSASQRPDRVQSSDRRQPDLVAALWD